MAPRVGFEPTVLRLTAASSTTELPGNVNVRVSADALDYTKNYDLKLKSRMCSQDYS